MRNDITRDYDTIRPYIGARYRVGRASIALSNRMRAQHVEQPSKLWSIYHAFIKTFKRGK